MVAPVRAISFQRQVKPGQQRLDELPRKRFALCGGPHAGRSRVPENQQAQRRPRANPPGPRSGWFGQHRRDAAHMAALQQEQGPEGDRGSKVFHGGRGRPE